ncbi:hypothetical protein GKZ89_00155 [Bacillus mangrovi]|uniref:Uncharacterized protein n=1 Tax=Metabacillus mangrovi TaxID=1491830 RepID=A0A7X2S0N5_9BACI|nr:hypothetical protein [Metabacillus mangrovi]MTH51798.1 hypothetical protein [Metabacillus mangrovi]
MKRHETQKLENGKEDSSVYSPTEKFEQSQGAGPLNKEGLKRINGFPKAIKFIGILLFGGLGLMIAIALFLQIFLK